MISVCLATYNGKLHIMEQVESILSQLGEGDELVISDNYSTDGTIDLLKSITDNRLKIIYEINPGVLSNFENALNHAAGDIIFLADQDDIWLCKKVEKSLSELETCDLILHDAVVVDSNLNTIHKSLFKLNKTVVGLTNNILKNHYVGCCMAFKRDLLNDALPFPKGIAMHDWWIGLIAECNYRVKLIDKPLIKYRRHENNVSMTLKRSENGFMKKVTMRIIILANLFIRLNKQQT